MTNMLFSMLGLSEKLEQAVEAMGFQHTTPIQAQTIPLIRTGVDTIARSQTGTGKTVAFSIPALECIDVKEEKPTVQVLVLCPTRELAQQAAEEIRKLAKFMPHIHPAEIYGGMNMERQIIRLRQANLVIGTPGRIMDHMRRRTLKLDHLKMIVLDEADEMLNMGFKEDIETILRETPEDRQTILFSATMPPAILTLAKQFQTNPQMVEIDKGQVTIQRIEQKFVDVPASRKVDALTLLLHYYHPNRALIFCNTKRQVDELTGQLNQNGFSAESIHGDLNQAQRTSVMNSFKRGSTALLIATDVAARGIDVNDLDYVFNYDIPMTTEYYVHRIGRTGRAGKSGCAITLCCGRRQVQTMYGIAREVKSEIAQISLPTPSDIAGQEVERNLETMIRHLELPCEERYVEMLDSLIKKGYTPQLIASVALQLQFPVCDSIPEFVPSAFREYGRAGESVAPRENRVYRSAEGYTNIHFDVGSAKRVAPNHLMGALTERSGISGKTIGKIQVYQDYSTMEVPSESVEVALAALKGTKVCGIPIHATIASDKLEAPKPKSRRPDAKPAYGFADRAPKPKGRRPAPVARHAGKKGKFTSER